jgi:hypothetical protein
MRKRWGQREEACFSNFQGWKFQLSYIDKGVDGIEADGSWM